MATYISFVLPKSKKVRFAVFIFLLLSFHHTEVFAQKKNYLEYHKQITAIEEDFMDGNSRKAVIEYEALFKEYPKSFAKDCYIAAQIALLANDTFRLKYFLDLCFKKGVEWSVVEEDSNLKAFLQAHPEIRSAAYANWTEGNRYFVEHINIPLRYEITAMVQKDQLYHELPEDYPKKDSLFQTVVNNNTERFVQIVKQIGYPGASKVGIANNRLDNTSYRLVDKCFEDIGLIIFYHQSCTYQLLKDELKTAVEDGDLHPADFATFYEWSTESIINATDTSSVTVSFLDDSGNEVETRAARRNSSVGDLSLCSAKNVNADAAYKICKVMEVYLYFSSFDDAKVNVDREKIGLPSLRHNQRKKDFEKKYGMTLFFGSYCER